MTTATLPRIITASDARGDSRPVTLAEFTRLADIGRAQVAARRQRRSPATGLDAHWNAIVAESYRATRDRWGGDTVDAHTGVALESDADLYALTFRPADTESVSVPIDAEHWQFMIAMDTARARFRVQLECADAHLGIFRDDDLGRIDIDPVLIVDSVADVETIGAYTHAIGGAYHFRSGDGFFPPHVADLVAA